MPVEKLSISLPDTLAASIDRYAAHDGVTRSFLIQEAAARYVAVRDAAGREQARRDSVDAALEGFDEIAREWGEDSRRGVDYLADIRGAASDAADASDE